MGLLEQIGGTARPAMPTATRHVAGGAESFRRAFLQMNSPVFPKVFDHLDAEFACDNLVDSRNSARGAGFSISRTLMSFTWTRPEFGLFQSPGDEFHVFVYCHRIVVYGIVHALVFDRITNAYSANASAAAIASQCCIDEVGDQAHRFPNAARGRNPAQSFPPALMEPFVVVGMNKFAPARGLHRGAVISAGCALLVCNCDVECLRVVFDFAVRRRVGLETHGARIDLQDC
jgi:nonribosomal peptide synthetase DhbF